MTRSAFSCWSSISTNCAAKRQKTWGSFWELYLFWDFPTHVLVELYKDKKLFLKAISSSSVDSGPSECVKVEVGNRRGGRKSRDTPGERLNRENYIQQIFGVIWRRLKVTFTLQIPSSRSNLSSHSALIPSDSPHSSVFHAGRHAAVYSSNMKRAGHIMSVRRSE